MVKGARCKHSTTPLAEAIKPFFNSPEIASDFDESKTWMMRYRGKVLQLLAPHLQPNWQDVLKQAVEDTKPQLSPSA